MSENVLIGKTIAAVDIAEDDYAIRFILSDGVYIVAKADADCCSRTWIDNVDGVEQLIGSPVASVEEVELRPDLDDGDGVTRFYGCKITTGAGYAMIDYRNSSNGYYGGRLVWPDDSFYGGDYGQNVQAGGWRRLAG